MQCMIKEPSKVLDMVQEISGQVTKWVAIVLTGLGVVTFEHKVALAGLGIAFASMILKFIVDVYKAYIDRKFKAELLKIELARAKEKA